MKSIVPRVAGLLAGCLALIATSLPAAEVAATFASATTVPVTVAGYVATGNTVNLALNFAPPTGTTLTVVKNTGVALIDGTFDNLTQGQRVELTYNNLTYPFVANYFGGTGNDLVLQWANVRMLSWGTGGNFALGSGTTEGRLLPGLVEASGALAGKVVIATAARENRVLTLCSDGSLVSWGSGYLGDGIGSFGLLPVAVDRSGVLAGKTPAAIAVGNSHSLVLCSDGTLVGWGEDYSGQLAYPDTAALLSPVRIPQDGVLAGKRIVAIAAGTGHSLVLCGDGTLAAFGDGGSGQLGNNTMNSSDVPVLVTRTGVLAGKTVTAIAAGGSHNLALCSDGTLAAWGSNSYGQLGNGTTTTSSVPVLVTRTGVLSGKTITAISGGVTFSLALCSDSTVAGWGYNWDGQLGNGETYNNKTTPALVTRTGVLSGKTVTGIAAGSSHGLVTCSDGTAAAWGYNSYGAVGDNGTTNRANPVLVATTGMRAGERFIGVFAGRDFSVAVGASGLGAVVATTPATGVKDRSATLTGSVKANGVTTAVAFEYGLTTAYGTTLAAVPASVTGTTVVAVNAAVSGLLAGSTYHYRVVASNANGVFAGADQVFSTTSDSILTNLLVEGGTLLPGFDGKEVSYTVAVPFGTTRLTLTPTAASGTSTIQINSVSVASGTAGAPIELAPGINLIRTVVSAAGGGNDTTYTLMVTRLPEVFEFASAASVPVTVGALRATGMRADCSLSFAPQSGTNLTVVNNTGAGLIQGTFDNLAQGEVVGIRFGGITYSFVANYHGGTGNDLVLHWANTRVLAWGSNSYGELGTAGSSTNKPVAVEAGTALAGRAILRLTGGDSFSFALGADGILAGWGTYNAVGLSGSSHEMRPVAVTTGALQNRKVVAVDAGVSHTLALAADGALVTWGSNTNGQLGAGNSNVSGQTPVLVDRSGVLAGKTITMIAAGGSSCLVLCSDGTLASWGRGLALGNGQTLDQYAPVLVNRAGVLAGKTVTALAVGGSHCLVLCSDGTLAAWGGNDYGQVGNNGTTTAAVPVLVTRSGVLNGKTITAIGAGSAHCLVLCSDGTLASWGYNDYGQLGNGTTTVSRVPVLVTRTGVLAGKTVIAIDANAGQNLVRCSDGTLAAWGMNSYGNLGNGTSSYNTNLPVLVNAGALGTGERFATIACGGSHTLATVASPPAPVVTSLAASEVFDMTATLNASVSGNGANASVGFEYGVTTNYGSFLQASPASVSGSVVTPVTAALAGLAPNTTYHFRVVATGAGGTARGADMLFNTSDLTGLRRLTVSGGSLSPAFQSALLNYSVTVPATTTGITVTPTTQLAAASVTVGGVPVNSATASEPIALLPGNNEIAVVVTNAGQSRSYRITVTRLQNSYTFETPATVPVTVAVLQAAGQRLDLALGHAPATGATLTVVNLTGSDFIQGAFDNLAQGQLVTLTFGGVTYPFVIDYFGGDGNDLVLRWANNRLVAWGSDGAGELGSDKSAVDSATMVAVESGGSLVGKSFLDVSPGSGYSLVRCADGSLGAWGNRESWVGDGRGSWPPVTVPTLVSRTGALAGKTIAAAAAGPDIRVAVCWDGTVVRWGDDGSAGSFTTPLRVAGDLLGSRRAVAVAVGDDHALILCADGELVAWGANSYGQLGDGTLTTSTTPVLVERRGALLGKTVIAIAAGRNSSYALCSDGTIAAWGDNAKGQLGDGTILPRNRPVLLDRSGVLTGKTVVELAAGGDFGVARCADGSLVSWGNNQFGQLGDGSVVDRWVPVRVNQAGVLAGKSVTAVSAGYSHSLVRCADGTLAAWGYNYSKQLGGTANSSNVPLLVTPTGLDAAERIMDAVGGGNHNLAMVAMPPPPVAGTLAATGVRDTEATLNASVNPQGALSDVWFEYGPTASYGTTAVAVPAAVSGVAASSVSAGLSGLSAGATYHFRVVARNAGGLTRGDDLTFTTTTFATLAGLSLSDGSLSPAFASGINNYSVVVPFATTSLSLTPVASYPDATVTVNGTAVVSGAASEPFNPSVGSNPLTVRVTSGDAGTTTTYTVTVVRLPGSFTFASATTVPLAVAAMAAGGEVSPIVLGFAPVPGTRLVMVNNTGTQPIVGTFANLAQGQVVRLPYAGVIYPFVANYFGGTGNDLVLHWANTRMAKWGQNTLMPEPFDLTGALAGKTVVLCGTGSHDVALTADGTLASWGSNSYGQLGNNSTTDQVAPVVVDRSGVLAGKNVIDLVVGSYHNLALCSDGTLVAWGYNNYGQLGINSTTSSLVPAAVNTAGVLAGKRVTALAAGENHNLALCADGTLAAWGYNNNGQLGIGNTANSPVPVAVDRSGVLVGKTVVAIAAGSSHSVALCADGTLAAWGYGSAGQLGNGSSANSVVPVLVTRSGVLAGKTVKAISAGATHNFALCTDGALVAWGGNAQGALGNGSSSNAYTPVLVTQTGVLAGKTISAAVGKLVHSLAICTDGTIAGWGYNGGGQLGNNSTTTTSLPVLASTTRLRAGERFISVVAGVGSNVSRAITAMPPPPSAITTAATSVRDDSAVLTASVEPNGSSLAVTFEFGPGTGYGSYLTATQSPVTGTGTKTVSYTLTGLPADATYHYRVFVGGPGGTVTGADMTFTTTKSATLAGLTTSSGAASPVFDMNRLAYYTTVPNATGSLTVTPTLTDASSSASVNGVAVVSGSASEPVALTVGNTNIPVVVDSGDGNNTKTYQLVVTRLPEAFAWPTATTVPVTAVDFLAAGNAPLLTLGHAPQTGAGLMVVNNTGSGPIRGAFGNLADGQRVVMGFGGMSYVYYVNYAGGTGNDLVLEWGNTRVMTWGSNSQGQQGDGTIVDVKVPTAVRWGEGLTGIAVRDVRAGFKHSLALTWDGVLVTWGSASMDSDGSGSGSYPRVVPATGALAGRKVQTIAVGDRHNLALCTDGTLAAWGYNDRGQLGNNSNTTSYTPVLVDRTGVLAGKEIVSIGAGNSFSAALCSDGTVIQWGWVSGGQSNVEASKVPVSMQGRGMAGKQVVKLRAGFNNWLALCSDGTLMSWGINSSGELGAGFNNASSDDRSLPQSVTMSGVLAGKTVTDMAMASGTCLAVCSDGTLVSWGSNYYGQLGIGSKVNSNVPVRVTQTGVLAGKAVVKVFGGQSQCYALCRDGTMAAWGYNSYGGLGNATTTDSMVPVLVSGANFGPGESFAWSGGPGSAYNQAVALSVLPPGPMAATLAATAVGDTGASLNAEVQPNGTSTQVAFEYGRTTAYGNTLSIAPLSGTGIQSAGLVLPELSPGATYHFRVVAGNSNGTATGADRTFTTTALATLAGLATSVGELIPGFAPDQLAYAITVPTGVASLAFTPVVANAGTTVKVNGVAVAAGAASAEVLLGNGATVIPVEVTSQDGGSVVTYRITVDRVPERFVFRADSGAGVTAAGFVATGSMARFELAYAPPVGSQLTVVDNTGIGFIRGAFDNLRQGQRVGLDFEGIKYVFVANYFGGTGNDLVLQWANTRLMGWGINTDGQVGDNSTTSRTAPVAVTSDGVLAGKIITAVSCGGSHTLAVCSDGTVAAWGANTYGQLGNNSSVRSLVPVAVDLSGELAGKTVVAVAAGSSHSLALCSDGTLAVWGLNTSGQLGNLGVPLSLVPMVIENRGVLAGKEVVAIAAGGVFNLAVTADGLLASWGANTVGQLGDGGTATHLEPVAVGSNSVLSGRQVKAVAAGAEHSLALCADGTLVAWGYNNAGQLGDGSTTTRLLPVKVVAVGALAGRQVARIAAGSMHSLAWCSDGALTGWGYNNNGELGIGSTTTKAETVPLQVITTGILAGKTIRRELASGSTSAAICTDGTLVAWGTTPTAVSAAGLAAGERFADGFGGRGSHLMITVARPQLAVATTLAATAVGETSAVLNAEVGANGSDAAVSFEYGLTTAYGSTVAAAPGSVIGGGVVAVSGGIIGLIPGTTYHFRVKAVNSGGTVLGEDRTLVASDLAGLVRLVISAGQLSPAFDEKTTDYLATVPFETGSVTLMAEVKNPGSVVDINGVLTESGVASAALELPVGNTRIPIGVSAEHGTVKRTYAVTVTRLPENLVFHAADDEPVTAGAFAAGGMLSNILLDFAPVPGTTLTLINNTGEGEIAGTFANLVHGQAIELAYGGALYPFVADYTGGSGNDLVLRWGNTRLMAWWDNTAGQLGDGSLTRRDLPTPVLTSGALAGKLVTAVSAGNSHVLALCADGTVAAWGTNGSGQLGVNGTITSSAVPMAVDASGVLAGKRVVRIAAGTNHNLVLCSDGTLASWGSNNIGQLGIPTGTASSLVPVAVNRIGALVGKTVTGIGVGEANSYAICADGTVVGWGSNTWGQLGNGANIGGNVPVAVDTSGLLAGKRVVSIDGGTYFCVALCADGTLAAWGYNASGQLGNNTRTDSWVPVAVDRAGPLAGKTVTLISAGPNHALARCADGTLVSWGYNGSGQLGNPVSNSSAVPVLMNTTGVLAGKMVTAVAAAGIHSLGLCDDGSLATWGPAPIAVDLSMLQPGERFTSIACGSGFNLGLVVSPPRSIATTVAAGELADTAATLRGRVNANGGSTPVLFEYGLTESYGATIAATPSSVTGVADTEVSARIGGLLPGTVYHFRVLAPGGAARGADLTFTTTLAGALASLMPGSGGLNPGFDPKVTDYALTVPATTTSVTLTPVAVQSAAVIKVNDILTDSGIPSAAVDLSSGTAVITVAVDAGDGVNATSYRVTVTRLPALLAFDAPTSVPVSADRFQVTGMNAAFELRHAPLPGASLTVLHSTGREPIGGNFANLAHGQLVTLEFGGVVYRLVANYYGGKGNDLVLQWADQRLLGWGSNDVGQLPGQVGSKAVPMPLDLRSVLAGRPILDWKVGGSHGLLLLADGSVASWGASGSGQLGQGSSSGGIVDRSGVLAGKSVVQLAAGNSHNLALCSDGTLVAWGLNTYGQLGDQTNVNRSRPVEVPMTGVLAGKRVLALAAGNAHSLVLCSDGTIAAWGYNGYGGLGNGSTAYSFAPVAVDQQGVLKGREVVAIAAGGDNSFAICADGTLAGWGANDYGSVGDNSSTSRTTPVLLNGFGALVGKVVTAVACGGRHHHALCADGTLVAWGYDQIGQLGDGGTLYGSQSRVPVLVDRSGVLAGMSVVAVAGGGSHSVCVNADGSAAAWGSNNAGCSGSDNTSASGFGSAVAVKKSSLLAGERFIAVRAASGSSTSFAMAAGPPIPVAETLAADPVGDASATLHGAVRANDTDVTLGFEYGLTTGYGTTLAATPADGFGTAPIAASAKLTGLLPGAIYHYRLRATSVAGTVVGGDMTFTTGTGAALAGLTLSSGALNPVFQMADLAYGVVVSADTGQVTVTPVAAAGGAAVRVNGTLVASGSASAPVALVTGNNPLSIAVTSGDGSATTTYQLTVTRLPEVFRFDAADAVPVTVDRLALDDQTAQIALGFVPVPGTRLTVVENTGGSPIRGTFTNLAQGQLVELPYAGRIYRFVANYFGGSGNDLVLEWAATRVLGWGGNGGIIGNGNATASKVPVPTDTSGVLSGRTIRALGVGSGHVLALGTDGRVAAWGGNAYGQLGNQSRQTSLSPVEVDASGLLNGRTVISVAAGVGHSLALCADGTLAAWGDNRDGQLGTGTTTSSFTPVAVDRSGVLAGKTIVAIAAGAGSSYAVCGDGTVAAWGGNGYGQLGVGNTTSSPLPVAVVESGALAGKRVVAVAAGESHVLALCADGTVAAWGSNSQAQLGNNNSGISSSPVPVLVDRTGVLAGKTVVALAVGQYHSLVLCSDGSMASWGSNNYRQLGSGSTNSYSFAPVAVVSSGVLAGKTATAIAAGTNHSLALCGDGTVASWGTNSNGQLGNEGITESSVPVALATGTLQPGERIVAIASNARAYSSLAVTVLPQFPRGTTLAASGIRNTSATLNGSANPDGASASLAFEYGLTTAYGASVAAVPVVASGTEATAVRADLANLTPGTVYHYRLRGTTPAGVFNGGDQTFTSGTDATLAGLTLSAGSLSPVFAGGGDRYTATLPFAVSEIRVTPLTASPGATVVVNGRPVASGTASAALPLGVGENPLMVTVTAPAGDESFSYSVRVTRLPEVLEFRSAADLPLVVGGLAASGNLPPVRLAFPPLPGTQLTLIRNTGGEPISGTFDNLVQGQVVLVDYAGTSYRFVASYYGGSGDDLVLRWANTRVVGWGTNSDGQLGNGRTLDSAVPISTGFGGLTGKPTVATVLGGGHGLALGADGLLEAAGYNSYGDLGDGTTTKSLVPVGVDRAGVLAGKMVVTVAAGRNFNLALCADGTVAAWGAGQTGTLGNGITANSNLPVEVDRSGVLAGKRVIALAGGENHALALCADGTVAAWGYSPTGALGVGTGASSYQSLPLRVATEGVLAGRTVRAIAAGGSHSLALCTDGTVVSWGANDMGQLGDNSTTARMVPVAVDASGVLAGKAVIAIAAGWQHSLALCADGTLVAWGVNSSGQLGNNTATNSPVPVLVDQSGVLAGKTIVSLAVGSAHSMVLCSDGSVVGWGGNGVGQLGNLISGNQLVPTAVVINTLATGERMTSLSSGTNSTNLAIVAMPVSSAVSGSADTITGTSATLHGSVNARNIATSVTFEYGVTDAYGSVAVASPATVAGKQDSAVASTLGGLLPGTIYHYRVVAENQGGIVRGADRTFLTLSDNALLGELGHDGGVIAPGFEKQRFDYLSSVPFETTAVAVSAVSDHPRASFTVNSAVGHIPIALGFGNNLISVVVTAEDGVTTKTYTITVNRLPQEFVFNTPGDIPLTSDGFAAGGNPVKVVLGFAPVPGTVLTMVNNTGLGFIYGRFGNLAQGQRIGLTHGGKSYDFIANYHGGSGNDLVLQWANTQLLAWGGNGFGQLGDDTTERRPVPTPVNDAGVLADQSVVSVAGGYLHSLALCADGTLAAWGYNVYGQLGNNGAANSAVPVAVDQTGVLAGKSVVSIAAGAFHSLALCEDGTVVAWGYNNHGQLGDGSKETRRVPVRVPRGGALATMQVVAVAAGAYQSFALGADGTVASWGYNDEGELGNGGTTGSLVPVAVDRSGALAGKRVASLVAGQYHTLALCTDGTLVAWGYNKSGQLGDNTTTAAASPVAMGGQGALAGKTLVGIAAGGSHSLAWCADGALAAWGSNKFGQLGVAGLTMSLLPVAVDGTGLSHGGGIGGLVAGANHSGLRGTDGRLVAWGENTSGQLGDGGTTSRTVPMEVLAANPVFLLAASGTAAQHNLALVALPAAQQGGTAVGLGGTDLLVHAFQLDPLRPSAPQLPQGRLVNGELVIQFTQPGSVTDIVYGAEWSATLQPGSWRDVADTGNAGEHRFAVPVTGAPRGFLRLKVERK